MTTAYGLRDLSPVTRRCTARHRSRGHHLVAVLVLATLSVPMATGQTTQPAGNWLGIIAERLMPELPDKPTTDATKAAKEQPAADAAADAETDTEGPPAVGVTPTGLLDVHVRDMAIGTLLELLSYQAQANIVTTTSVSGTISANLYGVSLEEALDAVLTPNHYAYRMCGKTAYVGTDEEIKAMQPPPATRVFRLRYTAPAEAAAAVTSVLSENAIVIQSGGEDDESGSSTSKTVSSAGTDYIIITDYADRLDVVEQLLAQIDRRPRQALIEATVLRATLNEGNQFGVDFTMLGGVDFQDVGGTSNASADLRTGQLPANDLQSTTFNVNTNFNGGMPGGGFTFGLVKDSVGGFIRALEDITDVVVVANPKLIALNKQQSEVIVGRRDGYVTTTVTETAAVQTVEFLETGTQIMFRPIINDDSTVRLSVHPKDSNGGLTAANLPFEETTEAQAEVLVDDGETILIGGLFRERTVSTESQIPLLGDIPAAGLLFGNRSDQTVREEVIILLTVHVIDETQDEQDQYAELMEDIERIRVGSRRGLLGTGRERLAQAHFHEALKCLEEGRVERALLNVRMTLHNQPKHLAAIKLEEQLLDERFWDDEGTRMRSFIWELIRPEEGVEMPFDRPQPQVQEILPLSVEQEPKP